MNDKTNPGAASDLPVVSDGEVWAAIRYLDPKARRGVGDILACMVLCWMVLFFCTIYLVLHVRP